MRLSYTLKQSDPVDLVTPLVGHLQEMYDPQTAQAFRAPLTQINELRNKVIHLNLNANTSDPEIDRMAELLSAYTRYALVLLNRFNWNSDRGKVVTGLTLTWYDSFQQKLEFKKSLIVFDVFCCYYNLAILQLTKCLRCNVETEAGRKQSMLKASGAAFLLRQMKQKYYGEFVNSGFHDTQFPHLDILESLCLGLLFKSLYYNLKPNQFKIGINKVAAVCTTVAKHFYKAYSVAQSFFMNPSGISEKTKTELLAITYIESLYFDVMTNARYAKHYGMRIDREPHLVNQVIAYEKKALRLLDLGLKNQSVETLLNQNMKQKNELTMMQNELQESLNAMKRYNQMGRAKQIEEYELQDEELPAEYDLRPSLPANLVLENEGDFAKLMSQQAYSIGQELSDLSNGKKIATQLTLNQVEDEIEKTYQESYVNYYLQLDEGPKKTIPQALQQKLLEIRKKGGKNKLNTNIKSITQQRNNMERCFKLIRQQLAKDQKIDQQKRQQYGMEWVLLPAKQANKQYVKQLEHLETKFQQARKIDDSIMHHCQKNVTFIETLNSGDETILKMLPKPELAKFVEVNKNELSRLHEKNNQLKKHQHKLNDLVEQIKNRLSQVNYPFAANNLLMKKMKREQILKNLMEQEEKMISMFNAEIKSIKDELQDVAVLSLSLNSKNKEQDKGKKQYEVIINCYNEIGQIFDECNDALAFYGSLNEFVESLNADLEEYMYARRQAIHELEESLNKKDKEKVRNELPEMYPGKKKQPLPQFTPPPLPPSLFTQGQGIWPPNNKFQENQHLQVPSQPAMQQFPSDPFKGNIYPTTMIGGNSPSNPGQPSWYGQLPPTPNQAPLQPSLPPFQMMGQPSYQNNQQSYQNNQQSYQNNQQPYQNSKPQGYQPMQMNQGMNQGGSMNQGGMSQGGMQGNLAQNMSQGLQQMHQFQQPHPPQINFNSDPFLGQVFPSAHLRR